jgi:ABC-type multidrug transport system fused ATPase/permease subunit
MDRKKWPFEHVAFNSMEVGITIVKLAIMFWIWKMVFGGQATMWELVGIVTLIGYLSSTSQSFMDMIWEYMKNGVNLTRFWEFLDTTPRIKNLHIWKKYSHSRWNIEIKNLSYSYERNKIFDDFSLTLQGCTQTAFVWASGSGKSTLIKLIAGYLSPHSWDVFIDWNALSSIKLSDYYKKVWYLTQDPSIFWWNNLW